jgi:hypothetical protein
MVPLLAASTAVLSVGLLEFQRVVEKVEMWDF